MIKIALIITLVQIFFRTLLQFRIIHDPKIFYTWIDLINPALLIIAYFLFIFHLVKNKEKKIKSISIILFPVIYTLVSYLFNLRSQYLALPFTGAILLTTALYIYTQKEKEKTLYLGTTFTTALVFAYTITDLVHAVYIDID